MKYDESFNLTVIFFTICMFMILVVSYGNNELGIRAMFKIVCSNYYPTRGLNSYKTISNLYFKKFHNFWKHSKYDLDNYMYDEEMCQISHRFFKILEFTVAEMLVRYCYYITTSKDAYFKNIIREKARKILNFYLNIFDVQEHQLIKIGLQVRVIMNLCSIENDIFSTFLVFEEFSRKELKILISHYTLNLLPNHKTYHYISKVKIENLVEFSNYLKKIKF